MDSDHGNDITVVMKMVKDYKRFINKPTRSSTMSERFSSDTTQTLDLFSSFNQSSSLGDYSSSRKRSSDADYLTLSKDEKADIIVAKSKVAKLETDLNSSQLEKRKLQIEEEARNKETFTRLSKEREESDTMRRRFKQVVNERDAAVTELKDLQKKFKASETLYNTEFTRLKDEKNHLKSTLHEASSSTSTELTDLREKCSRQSADLLMYKSKLEEVELQLKTFKMRHEKASVLCQDYNEVKYRCDISEAKCKTLQEKLSRVEDTSMVMQHSQLELANYRSLEKENKHLKEENQLLRDGEENMLILNEKIRNLTQKLEHAETTIEQLRQHEYENEILRERLAEHGDRPKSVGELTRIITELQNSTISSNEKNGELEMSLSILDATFVRKLEEMTSLAESTVLIQNKHDQLDDRYNKLQRRLILITGERDGLRRVLSSYEAEDGKGTRVELEEAKTINQQAQKQIESLEKRLAEMRSELSQLKANNVNNTFHSQLQSDDTLLSLKDCIQLDECKKRLVQLQNDCDQFKAENEDLKLIMQHRESRGEYNPKTTRILQMKNSPMQIAYENYARETENIRVENEKLRKNVLKLQNQLKCKAEEEMEDDESCMDVSKLIKSSKHMEEVRKELEREKLTKKKLKEQFAKEVNNFRTAIQQIFGYSFKATKDGVYKAQSIYSTHEDDFFLFTCSKNKEGETLPGMIETTYTRQWMQLLKDYVQNGDSIPAFLASVTLELFSQTTEVRDMSVAQRAKQM